MEDRAQYDGDRGHLDEVVIHNATVHIEAMDAHNWAVIITRGTDVQAHFNAQNITETEDMTGVPYVIHPPLLICTEWHDRHGIRHMCTVNHKPGRPLAPIHRCECGARNLRTP